MQDEYDVELARPHPRSRTDESVMASLENVHERRAEARMHREVAGPSLLIRKGAVVRCLRVEDERLNLSHQPACAA